MSISGIYCITNGKDAADTINQAQAAFHAKANALQIRCKNLPSEEMKNLVTALENSGIPDSTSLIINDFSEISQNSAKAGLHIGQTDGPPSGARSLLGNKKIIGLTVNEADDIKKEDLEDVDYVGLGPYKFTNTKDSIKPLLGLEGTRLLARKIRSLKEMPVFAIGGIELRNIKTLAKEPDIQGVAVSSAIWSTSDPAETIKEFKECWRKYAEDS